MRTWVHRAGCRKAHMLSGMSRSRGRAQKRDGLMQSRTADYSHTDEFPTIQTEQSPLLYIPSHFARLGRLYLAGGKRIGPAVWIHASLAGGDLRLSDSFIHPRGQWPDLPFLLFFHWVLSLLVFCWHVGHHETRTTWRSATQPAEHACAYHGTTGRWQGHAQQAYPERFWL